MSELWIPDTDNQFDAKNVFQMAQLLQGELEQIEEIDAYGQYVEFALESLSQHIADANENIEEFRVDSLVAIVEDRLQTPILQVDHATCYGFVSSANLMTRRLGLYGLAIRMEATSIQSCDAQESATNTMSPVNIPASQITHVRFA